MDSMSMKYATHLDNLRRQQKISIRNFVEDVISERTYTRYLNGTRNISHNSIVKLCSKLGIRYHDFYHSYQKYYDQEYAIVNKLYKLLIEKSYDEFIKLNKKTINMTMLDVYNERYLTFINIRYGVETNSITPAHGYELYKNLKKKYRTNEYSYDFVDVLILIEMLKYEEEKKEITSLTELYNMVSNQSFEYMSASNRQVFPGILSTVSLSFGRIDKLEESFNVAIEGIKYSLKYNHNEHLTLLYYLVFLYYWKTSDQDNMIKYAELCISNSIARQNNEETTKYRNLIYKDTGLVFESRIEKKD